MRHFYKAGTWQCILARFQTLAFVFANSINAVLFHYESFFFWLKFTVKGSVRTAFTCILWEEGYAEPRTELSVRFGSLAELNPDLEFSPVQSEFRPKFGLNLTITIARS